MLFNYLKTMTHSTIMSRNQMLALIILLATLLLNGCSTVAPRQHALTEPELLLRAEQAQQAGMLDAAASHYIQASNISDTQKQSEYRLKAADLLLKGNYIQQAQRALQTITPSTPVEKVWFKLLQAKLALAAHNNRTAIKYLAGKIPKHTPADLKREIFYLRAEAYSRSSRYLDAAHSRIMLSPLIEDDIVARHNTSLIWRELLENSSRALQQSFGKYKRNTDYNSWVSLALIVKLSEKKPDTMQEKLEKWESKYSNHPIPATIISSLYAQAKDLSFKPTNIALLLPLSGAYSKPATSILDGFMSAYYNRQNKQYQPLITVYDTADTTQYSSPKKSYEAAVNDGADFIIGPLNKQFVNQLGKKSSVDVTTLTLNYSETKPPYAKGLFQFGLSPEDEARQIAEKAWLNGHNQAITLVPEGEWGARILQAFEENWRELGGLILETQTYPAQKNDFSPQIKNLLNIDESTSRHLALRRLLVERIYAEPRRRQDADFVFMVALPRQARLIRPQMKFHYASNLPLYATSHIYSGQVNRNADRDMDGIFFCDMPWLLDTTKQIRPIKKQLRKLWPERSVQYTRFFALGYDAFNLSPRLGLMNSYQHESHNGQTGLLQLTDSGRIFRQLKCGKFKNGLARPM